MSFSAGGANVGGVQSIEQGSLTINNTATTFSNAGGESLNVDVTVPAGHKWILKEIRTSTSNFVGTRSFTSLQILDSGSGVIGLGTGSTSDVIIFTNQQITIPAGFKLRFSLTTSAWTSGQLLCNLLYQDITV